MDNAIYTFRLSLGWTLINHLSQIDRFAGTWTTLEKRQRQTLKHLKSIATVRSVGASTRIEGSKMTDDEVEILLKNLNVAKLEERDEQEVAGYFAVLDFISTSFRDIEITENNVLHLHNLMLKHSKKDEWHKGRYKQHRNAVEATNPDGSKHTIFRPAEPGLETEEAMRNAIAWYNHDRKAHPVVSVATFIYEFLTIHPFQDGNGRLSRLLATLLLLKHGYSWIEYISFEHEIESRKSDYYKVLMNCQRQRPGEDIHEWIMFFLDCLTQLQDHLMKKLEIQHGEAAMPPRVRKIYQFIENHPGSKSGEIADKLQIPLPTVKRILSDMLNSKYLQQYGSGAGTNYIVDESSIVKRDLLFTFTAEERKKTLLFTNPASFVEIKKIILSPKFNWVVPHEWANILFTENPSLFVTIKSKTGNSTGQYYWIYHFFDPHIFQPVFVLRSPIIIPFSMRRDRIKLNEYPLEVNIELNTPTSTLSFDVLIVYDEA